MDGLGTDEAALIEIIAPSSNSQLQTIKQAYLQRYGVSLEKDVESETSGDFIKLLISLLNANRSEYVAHIQNNIEVYAAQEAKELYQAGEGLWGTDESVLNRILTKRSTWEIQAIQRHYQQFNGKTLYDAIDAEVSGDSKRLLKTILQVLANPPEYFAHELKKAIKGWGTNDKLLIRVIISRNEIDMHLIKKAYQEFYGRSMIEDIANDITGDYSNIIMELASH